MKRSATLFLKLVISLIAIAVLAICIFGLPKVAADDAARHPELAWQQYPFLTYAYILAILFFVALYKAFNLLTLADANKTFSELSVRALKYIKYCAIMISTLVVVGVLTVMILSFGKGEDMTGIVMMGLIITLGSSVGATFAAVLQNHVQKAIEIKSENDLTI